MAYRQLRVSYMWVLACGPSGKPQVRQRNWLPHSGRPFEMFCFLPFLACPLLKSYATPRRLLTYPSRCPSCARARTCCRRC
ncbi:hypothetical protein M405DRAFT_570563 [Rhizopogon salebrosus TDB-379]|nr:hypothetical protein M405DRAFT_570563 [Rhizopogon salebrosus TDB-379]